MHDLWAYPEPQVEIDGCTHTDAEEYYHSQKPKSFDDVVWTAEKDGVMQKAKQSKR